MSVIAVANAEPYVGINLIYDNIQLDKSFGETVTDLYIFGGPYDSSDLFAKNSFGASIDLGYQFSDYLGAEAYFQYNLNSSVDVSLDDEEIWDSKSNFMSGGLDIIGYLPLNSCHSFSLIGTIGGGYYRFENKNTLTFITTETIKQHEDHFALRMGAGFQYNFNESMSVRALGRYVMWKHDNGYNVFEVIDNLVDYNQYPDMIPVNGMWEGSVGFQYKF